ncbi:four helix bundle protein [Brucella sp. IR073]|uniref:four helix bundle protein n=1 Tax=unclassified Brucella TaxID=2632610 RepID=UPI003B97FFD3
MAINSYRDIMAWQQAMELVTAVYKFTESWPREEIYGLTGQVRRAAVSIPANIAEEYGRDTRKAYQQFLRIAQGSLKELETHLLIAERLGFSNKEAIAPIIALSESVGKLLRLLIRKLSEPE